MTEELKFCVDCAHYKATVSLLHGDYMMCHANPDRDCVTGNVIEWNPYNARGERGACGPEGKLWEKWQEVVPEMPAPPPPEPESPEVAYRKAMHSLLGMQGTIRIAPEPDDNPWWKFW